MVKEGPSLQIRGLICDLWSSLFTEDNQTKGYFVGYFVRLSLSVIFCLMTEIVG